MNPVAVKIIALLAVLVSYLGVAIPLIYYFVQDYHNTLITVLAVTLVFYANYLWSNVCTLSLQKWGNWYAKRHVVKS